MLIYICRPWPTKGLYLGGKLQSPSPTKLSAYLRKPPVNSGRKGQKPNFRAASSQLFSIPHQHQPGPTQHRGALRGTPGSACPQPEPNATELPSCARGVTRALGVGSKNALTADRTSSWVGPAFESPRAAAYLFLPPGRLRSPRPWS